MPIRESWCDNKECKLFHREVEHFYHHSQPEDEPCEACGGPTVRLISGFSAPWTGTLDRYLDPNCSMHNQVKNGGHIQWRVKSSRLADGTPEKVIINTRQDQLEFCRAEGLVDPFEINHSYGVGEGASEDGLQSSTRLRGSWV